MGRCTRVIRRGLTAGALAALLVLPPAHATTTPAGRCGGEAATIVGTDGDDRLVGTRGDDVIVGYGGDDVIIARGGVDVICAGAGDDVVEGGWEADHIRGGRGADRLFGEHRDQDRNAPRQGCYGLYGEASYSGASSSPDCGDRIVGGPGSDRLEGGPFEDYLFGGSGHDRLLGQRDGDYLDAGSGDDLMNGGPGRDTASFWWAPGGVDVDLEAHVATGWGTDRVVRIQDLLGSRYADTLAGTDGRNHITGGEGSEGGRTDRGDDVIRGRGGNDSLQGEGGDDTIRGGGGNDFLNGDLGFDRDTVDTLHGGAGEDECIHGERVSHCENPPQQVGPEPIP